MILSIFHQVIEYKSVLKMTTEQPANNLLEEQSKFNLYDNEEYNKMLADYPEVRPFDIDTDIPKIIAIIVIFFIISEPLTPSKYRLIVCSSK